VVNAAIERVPCSNGGIGLELTIEGQHSAIGSALSGIIIANANTKSAVEIAGSPASASGGAALLTDGSMPAVRIWGIASHLAVVSLALNGVPCAIGAIQRIHHVVVRIGRRGHGGSICAILIRVNGETCVKITARDVIIASRHDGVAMIVIESVHRGGGAGGSNAVEASGRITASGSSVVAMSNISGGVCNTEVVSTAII
jgi:hypothetical protein